MTVSVSHQDHQRRLTEKMGGSLVVLSGYKAMQYMSDQAAPFIQEANFWWLTGINEPGWSVIIDGARGKNILVHPYRSEQQRLFEGSLSDEEVARMSGIETIIEEKDFESSLRQLRRYHSMVYTIYDDTKYDFVSNPAGRVLHEMLERNFQLVKSCQAELARLRAIKLPAEVEQIKQAVRISIAGFNEVKRQLPSIKHEYEIDAILSYEFRKAGAVHAYEPIVAHGGNACVLHYQKNNAAVTKKRPTLIDVAARYRGYASDITRTYAAQPTKRQLEIHQALDAAQKEIVNLIRPGFSVREYLEHVDEIMKEALLSLRLLKSDKDERAYRTYFPHAISHGLGVDVHESLGAPGVFEPGMILTVEPGIYVDKEQIGMRIEDTVLVTEKGRQNLSEALSTALI